MSKLVKLKLASKKSLACFLPKESRMESSTLFSEARPRPNGISPKSKASENPVRDMPRPNGTNSKAMVDKPNAESKNSKAVPGSENPVRDMVSYGTKEKEKEQAPKVEEEEILELKTPGFIRVFGCDNCANDTSDTEDTRPSCSHHSSSDASDDDDDSHHHHHQPPHLIPVVHLRVPMTDQDDVRKVVAALQIKGVREVACDLENQIVKVSGTADPDRLLKKAKKVKRKSRLISYSNPREEIPPPPSYAFHHQPQPPYSVPLRPRHYEEPPFHRPPPAGASYDHHHRPPPPAAYYDHHHRPTTSAPPPAAAAYYDHHHRPTTNVRAPPPPTPGYYDEFYRRAPSSPPHYGSRGFYPERSHRSTSPPRRRSYRTAPHFRPPPPVVPGPPLQQHYASGPRSPPVVPGPVPLQQHYGGRPWIPSAPYGMDDFHQVPHRSTMHMYH